MVFNETPMKCSNDTCNEVSDCFYEDATLQSYGVDKT